MVVSKKSSTFAPSNKNKQQFKTITIMKTETTMSYKNLVEYCEKLAHELHTIMETREYTEFGWASIVFETDKFGGDYVNLHYDLNTGIVTNWYGSDRARVVDNLDQLKMMVKYYMKKMLKARDMNAVSDFINSQY